MSSACAERGGFSMNYGIRVKNPLTKHVRVELIDGKTIIRETVITPGFTKFISVERPGTYDLRTTILDRAPGAIDDELGPGSWKVTDHQEVKEPEMKPVSLVNTIDIKIPREQKTARYWRNIIVWRIPPGSIAELLTAEGERLDGVEWRVKIAPNIGDGRREAGRITNFTGIATFENVTITGGQSVILQARHKDGLPTSVSGRLSGRIAVVNEDAPPTKVEVIPEVEEEEEVPVRSLADMFKELEEQEVPV